MATTIAVYYRFIMFVERIECFIEHRIHQRRVRACSYRPAYNLAIKAVDNLRQIDDTGEDTLAVVATKIAELITV